MGQGGETVEAGQVFNSAGVKPSELQARQFWQRCQLRKNLCMHATQAYKLLHDRPALDNPDNAAIPE